jgi:hypothetical protein
MTLAFSVSWGYSKDRRTLMPDVWDTIKPEKVAPETFDQPIVEPSLRPVPELDEKENA